MGLISRVSSRTYRNVDHSTYCLNLHNVKIYIMSPQPTMSTSSEQIIPSTEFFANYDHSRFSWWRYIDATNSQAALLESFPNSPCHFYAQHIQPGTVVEVLNPDGQGNNSNAYWFAEIIERLGLKIKVSYIGCRGKLELWLNATDVYPVGFCINENKKQMLKMSKNNKMAKNIKNVKSIEKIKSE